MSRHPAVTPTPTLIRSTDDPRNCNLGPAFHAVSYRRKKQPLIVFWIAIIILMAVLYSICFGLVAFFPPR